jgi:PAS domain S-box-containing protein
MSATTTADFRAGGTVQWAFVDVSAEVQFERRLVEMANVWIDVFNVLREGVIVIDRDGITVAANAAAADFLGTDLQDLSGSLARAQVVVVDENGLPMARERLPSTRAFATGSPQEENVAYRRRDGSTRWLQARVVPLTHPPEKEPERVAILLEDAVGPSHEHTHGAVQEAALTALTRRELDVLELLAQGFDVTSAATTLNISVHTARGHLKQLMRKLDARSQLQAVVVAARAGLVRVE